MGKSHSRSHTAPTLRPSTKDIAWAAGIYEGEGNCQRAIPNRKTEVVRVVQKDDWLCPKLRDLFGGSTRVVYKRNGYRYNQWTLCGSRARGFLMTIYIFLSPRRQEQILKALCPNEYQNDL